MVNLKNEVNPTINCFLGIWQLITNIKWLLHTLKARVYNGKWECLTAYMECQIITQSPMASGKCVNKVYSLIKMCITSAVSML